MFQRVSDKRATSYVQILQLFTELTELPPSAIHIQCYDFKGPMNSSGHLASLKLRQFLKWPLFLLPLTQHH
jgi:hypothetical protein